MKNVVAVLLLPLLLSSLSAQAIEPTGAVARAQSQPPPIQPLLPDRPDVVVFLLDDVGAYRVEVMRGQGRLPAFDALAEIGAEFTHTYAQPMCAPSRWGFLLGTFNVGHAGFACHPLTNGLGPGPQPTTLAHGLDSLPKAMEAAGYNTALFGRWGVGTWLGSQLGTQDFAFTPMLWGFEAWRAGIADGSESCGGTGHSDWLRIDDGLVSWSTEYHTTAVRAAFIEWWESTPSPRFAVVSLHASSHEPFHYPPASAMRPGWVNPGSAFVDVKFQAMVEAGDYAVEQMLAVVDSDGTFDLDDAFVVLTADNGDPEVVALPPYTAQQGKHSTFNGGVRVPGFFAGLGLGGGMVSGQPVSLTDFTATFSDLAGVCFSLPSNDGQSILPAFASEQLERGWVYVEAVNLTQSGNKAVIEERWKLRELQSGNQFLYDLDADPFEKTPLNPDTQGDPDVVARLRAELAEAQL